MQDLDEDPDFFSPLLRRLRSSRVSGQISSEVLKEQVKPKRPEPIIQSKIHQSQNIFLSNILMFAAFLKENIVSWIYMIVRQKLVSFLCGLFSAGIFYFWKREA